VETALVQLDALRMNLAQIQEPGEVKDIRDRAEALRGYAKARGESLLVQNEFAEVKLIAERRAGEMLAGMERVAPSDTLLRGSVMEPRDKPTLSDLGIGKKQSHRWQLEASVSEEAFLRYVAETKAENEELTSAGLLGIAKKLDREERRERARTVAQTMPTGTFNVILADPPWRYDNVGVHGAVEPHYPTMSIEDICDLGEILPVAENAALFLWATNPLLQDAFFVIDAWSFDYKTNIVWVKTELRRPGSGWYVRGRHELCLICVRGSFTPLDENISPPIGSVIEAPVSEHSEKPEELYGIIEQLYPDCSYLEVFARKNRDGWTSWGDEIS